MSDLLVDLAHKRLIQYAEKFNNAILISAGPKQHLRLIKNDKENIYFLKSGDVELRRVSDNIVITNFQSPAVIGLSLERENKNNHYLKTTIESELILMSLDDALILIEEYKLWHDAFVISSRFSQDLLFRDVICNSRSVYSIIREHIELLWQYDEKRRLNISIYDFIISRTHISRSSLNKILKDLISGGYIKTQRGKLIEKKRLPLDY